MVCRSRCWTWRMEPQEHGVDGEQMWYSGHGTTETRCGRGADVGQPLMAAGLETKADVIVCGLSTKRCWLTSRGCPIAFTMGFDLPPLQSLNYYPACGR